MSITIHRVHQDSNIRPDNYTHKDLQRMHSDYYRREALIQNTELILGNEKIASLLRQLVRLLTPDTPTDDDSDEKETVEETVPPTPPAPAE